MRSPQITEEWLSGGEAEPAMKLTGRHGTNVGPAKIEFLS
jgi:hypothetical protein